MGGCHRRRDPPVPPRPPRPGSPVQRTPLAVSTMEKPSGQTRATSWHPPWLQERSQPYSPHVPGGSETRTGGPRGTDATSRPSPALWYPLPGSPGTCALPWQHPYPCQGWGLCWGMLQGEVTRSNVPCQESPGVPAFGTTASRSGWVPGQVMPCSPSGHEQRLGATHKPLPQPKEQSAAGSGDGRLLGGQGPPPAPRAPRARTHAGCTARCPETASTRDNIRCRSPRSRRGARRGACVTDEKLRPPYPEPPGRRAKVPGELLQPAGNPPPREREEKGDNAGAVATCPRPSHPGWRSTAWRGRQEWGAPGWRCDPKARWDGRRGPCPVQCEQPGVR